MSAIVISFFFIMLTLTVDTVLGSALSPLCVNMILFTLTGATAQGEIATNCCPFQCYFLYQKCIFNMFNLFI